MKCFLILVLALIASVVFSGLLRGANMWGWITAYWLILTVKNSLDFIDA